MSGSILIHSQNRSLVSFSLPVRYPEQMSGQIRLSHMRIRIPKESLQQSHQYYSLIIRFQQKD
jgi:hypothetical protein